MAAKAQGHLDVGFDREIFVRQQRGGISRYFAELIQQFARDELLQIEPHLLFSRNSNAHLRDCAPQAVSTMTHLRSVPRGTPRLVNQADLIKDAYLRLRAGSTPSTPALDWMHATYLRPMPSDIARARKLAFTVYDMTPEILKLDTLRGPYRGKYELANRADLILTISHTSASHFNEFFPGLQDKLVTIPLGVDAEFFEQSATGGSVAAFPYALFLGSRAQYKGFELLVAALGAVRASGQDLGLVVAGPALTDHERAQVLATVPADRLHACTPTDAELVGLYQHATAFVFPSQYEGFGLPILEALAAGCPVIATDIPVFREVAGAAVLYFEKDAVEALQQAILTTLAGDPGREQRKEAGRALARSASWQATAAATAAAYRQFS